MKIQATPTHRILDMLYHQRDEIACIELTERDYALVQSVHPVVRQYVYGSARTSIYGIPIIWTDQDTHKPNLTLSQEGPNPARPHNPQDEVFYINGRLVDRELYEWVRSLIADQPWEGHHT